jgi:transposase
MTVVLTPGQRHELTVAERLLRQGAVRRRGRGRPRLRPERLSADKGYRSTRFRRVLRRRGIRVTIPRKANEARTGPFSRALYRLRHKVECFFNRAKQYRSLATRYDKLGETYRTMWVIVATILWLPA